MNNNDFWLAQEDLKKGISPEDNMEVESMKREKLFELKKKVENIEISYDYEDTYCKLNNACIDYMNETQDFSLEYLFEDYIDYDLAEEIAKRELEKGGLERLRYYMGDTYFYYRDIFKIDAYGNLSNIDIDDLKNLKDEIIYCINQKIEENI